MNEFKNAMQYFLPHYITYDLPLKKNEHFELKTLFGLWNYHIDYTNIRYKQPEFDMLDTKIEFTDIFGKQMLKVDMPTFKYWKIEANQHIDFMFLP